MPDIVKSNRVVPELFNFVMHILKFPIFFEKALGRQHDRVFGRRILTDLPGMTPEKPLYSTSIRYSIAQNPCTGRRSRFGTRADSLQ